MIASTFGMVVGMAKTVRKHVARNYLPTISRLLRANGFPYLRAHANHMEVWIKCSPSEAAPLRALLSDTGYIFSEGTDHLRNMVFAVTARNVPSR